MRVYTRFCIIYMLTYYNHFVCCAFAVLIFNRNFNNFFVCLCCMYRLKSGTGSVFCLESEEIDVAVEKAVKAGGVSVGEQTEGDGACCGGRVGTVKDPYGNIWMICSPAAKKAGADVEA